MSYKLRKNIIKEKAIDEFERRLIESFGIDAVLESVYDGEYTEKIAINGTKEYQSELNKKCTCPSIFFEKPVICNTNDCPILKN